MLRRLCNGQLGEGRFKIWSRVFGVESIFSRRAENFKLFPGRYNSLSELLVWHCRVFYDAVSVFYPHTKPQLPIHDCLGKRPSSKLATQKGCFCYYLRVASFVWMFGQRERLASCDSPPIQADFRQEEWNSSLQFFFKRTCFLVLDGIGTTGRKNVTWDYKFTALLWIISALKSGGKNCLGLNRQNKSLPNQTENSQYSLLLWVWRKAIFCGEREIDI